MSESASMMGPSAQRMIALLLMCLNTVCLRGYPHTGVAHSLHCVNDYLLTINCSLSLSPSENTSFWLSFYDTFEMTEFVCMLKNTSRDNGEYFCSTNKEPNMTFVDLDEFEISLCRNRSDGWKSCEVLIKSYKPVTNIKLNRPRNLKVSQNSTQHHFTWESTYEEHRYISNLFDNLKYQLRYYKTQGRDDAAFRDINTESLNYSVDDDKLVPDTDYTAKVRSCPNGAFYKGEWSDWSSEVHWTTEADLSDPPIFEFVSRLGMKVLIPLLVIVPLILLLCYVPVKKWRQSAFIPTPAPYFQTLYSDCQGDFKSWVVTQENTTDVLKAEETLQIDSLTKCVDVQEKDCLPHIHQQLMEGSIYSNVTNPDCDPSLLGIPYAVSTMASLSTSACSLKSLTLSFQPGSPAEGDSGCWLCSDASLENDSPWYCNEYCTLSTFQQSSPVTAQHQWSPSTKACPTEIITVDAIRDVSM
ncbi:hypothetical protein PAMA_012607 [Pampus argenteus]